MEAKPALKLIRGEIHMKRVNLPEVLEFQLQQTQMILLSCVSLRQSTEGKTISANIIFQKP